MLYLAFPDQYERIISTRDKDRIIATYRHRLEGPVPDDRDEAIRRIRGVLGDEHDKPDRPFDFYDELKHEWRGGEPPPPNGGNGNGGNGPIQSSFGLISIALIIVLLIGLTAMVRGGAKN